jgi:hypothetical protein
MNVVHTIEFSVSRFNCSFTQYSFLIFSFITIQWRLLHMYFFGLLLVSLMACIVLGNFMFCLFVFIIGKITLSIIQGSHTFQLLNISLDLDTIIGLMCLTLLF